jgi:CubicO group peptidase (beta-lactamase class C family)
VLAQAFTHGVSSAKNKHMYNLLFLPMLSLVLLSCNPQSAPSENPSPERIALRDSLRQQLTALHAGGHINGFGVAIVNEKDILFEGGFGFADVNAQRPYTARTVQNIASISKTLIGIALLKAQEMGKLNLDDPLSKYLDFTVRNPHFPEAEITLRQLATHTSSITDGAIYDEKSYILHLPLDSLLVDSLHIPEEFNPPGEHTDMEVLLQAVLDEQGQWYSSEQYLQEPPGALFEYSNIGATLAAYVLEIATGEKYPAFTTKHILEPLGMTSSGWVFSEIDMSRHTKLYASPSTELPLYTLITYPDGGLLTSAHELGLYLQELIRGYMGEGTLLRQESYQELFTPQLEEANFSERDADFVYNDEYNLGIFMGFSAHDYIGHTGGDPGVSSLMFFHTANKTGRLLLLNTDLINDEAFEQFVEIWNTLEKYQDRLVTTR